MSKRPNWRSMTIEEYRDWKDTPDATRPITADPIGYSTSGRRLVDANNSAVVDTNREPRPAERARTGGEGAVWPPEPRKRLQGPLVAQETEIATEAS